MNNVNIKHIDFSTVLKPKKVGMARQQAHVENFLWLKLAWLLFTKRFRKSGWKENGARLFWLFQRKISGSSVTSQKKKNQTHFLY